ncbi:putative protein phosphatase 2C 52 [Acorus gramineus]|uniref:protein-serine/threonine phosphatase n=1 Tax=Acorus gramineus TaxID=55184 RepID=A0AAV9AZ19_ACOGR|nr:putative protein phosphatase 2C 52 [Acorus gramineus]
MVIIYPVLRLSQEDEVDKELEFMVLASDGLWDVVPNEVSIPLPPQLHEHHCVVLYPCV